MIFSNLLVLALINLAPTLHARLTEVQPGSCPIDLIPSALDHLHEFTQSYRKTEDRPKRRLIVIDNNGPLVPNRDPLVPGSGPNKYDVERAVALLTKLAADPDNCVWVITARNQNEMIEYNEIPNLNIGTEHGAITRLNKEDGLFEQDSFDFPKAEKIRATIDDLAKTHGVTLEPRPTHSSAAFTYAGNDQTKMDKFFEDLRAYINKDENGVKPYKLDLLSTGVALVSNPFQNKGPLVEKILSDPAHDFEVGFSIGDKATDEAMHRLMKGENFYSVVVAGNLDYSCASHRLENTEEVHTLLNELIKANKAPFPTSMMKAPF
ncbi:hypothetical protein Pst134EA_024222 [Puccinia striiformis f. sp. tritici]|uniref:hypothetical protein n=1 Tax=Puccinia striiformis f. sp. tritici TaxID=168172 RepID=UPI0020075DF6|nr:hypothetical protein Pst134EA_024222 [Puccinia striiformis f. sp. tritici]KAH9453345.1 hypothetical protein Pst134EA_024222 [Puccinia striiformis f. sp. tritici]